MSDTVLRIVAFGGYIVVSIVGALAIGVYEERDAARLNKNPDRGLMVLGFFWPVIAAGFIAYGVCQAFVWTTVKLARTHTLPEVKARERAALAARLERQERMLGVGRDE